MVLILLRHGETVGNRLGLILGQRDYALTSAGVASTRKLGDTIVAKYLGPSSSGSRQTGMERFRGMVFSSPLGRATASAEIYAEKTGWPTIILAEMAELACGEWEGKVRKKVAPDRPTIRGTWTEFPPGGESYQGASARVKAAIDAIQAVEDVDLALVVGHGSVNRLFLKIWLDLDPAHAMTINQQHDVAYVLAGANQVSWINADGQTGQGLGAE